MLVCAMAVTAARYRAWVAEIAMALILPTNFGVIGGLLCKPVLHRREASIPLPRRTKSL